MSRSDQFIGLTKAGKNFIDNFPNEEIVKKKRIKVCHQAFNNWQLEGYEIRTKDRIYREESQITPWSSGPMYFWHIAVYTIQNKLIGYMFSWKEDPNLANEHMEYNSETGTYWV